MVWLSIDSLRLKKQFIAGGRLQKRRGMLAHSSSCYARKSFGGFKPLQEEEADHLSKLAASVQRLIFVPPTRVQQRGAKQNFAARLGWHVLSPNILPTTR
jgi:hypothetical protein